MSHPRTFPARLLSFLLFVFSAGPMLAEASQVIWRADFEKGCPQYIHLSADGIITKLSKDEASRIAGQVSDRRGRKTPGYAVSLDMFRASK